MISPRIVKVDASKLNVLLREYSATLNKSIAQTNLIAARSLTRELIKYTAPYDPGNFTSAAAALKTGKAAVARDVKSVYMTGPELFEKLKAAGKANEARAVYRLMRSSQGEAILKATGIRERNVRIGAWDGGAAHKAARSRRDGRVHRQVPVMAIPDAKDRAAYIKKKQDQVGFTRAGWLSAGLRAAIGGLTGFPKWVTKWQGTAPGGGAQKLRGQSITLSNLVAWTSRSLTPDKVKAALNDTMMKLRKSIQIVAAKRRRI